jgi:hypothetical protein
MAYTPYYTGGWQSGEEGGTPITPDALNHMEEGIEDANDLDATPTQGSTKPVQSGGVYNAIEQSTASMPLIYKPTGTITTSNIGAFALNTGISLSGKRVFVLSNYGASNSTQYNFFVDSFESSGAVNLRVRKIGDGTAVAETSIDLTKIALIIV